MDPTRPGQMTAFPVINPDAPASYSPLAMALLENQHQPDNWVFTPITDWNSDEAKSIRYEITSAYPDLRVAFRGAVHNGIKGTAMHLVTKEEYDRQRAPLSQ